MAVCVEKSVGTPIAELRSPRDMFITKNPEEGEAEKIPRPIDATEKAMARKNDDVNTVLLIGVGNEFRGDDAVGILLARRLKNAVPDLRVIEQHGEGTALMDAWLGSEGVIVLDAVCSGSAAGRVHRFNAHETELPRWMFRTSSHEFGVAEAIETARILQLLPPRIVVYGIEGKNFEMGADLSAEVELVLDDVERELKGVVQWMRSKNRS